MSDPESPDPRELPRFDAIRQYLNGNPDRAKVLAWVDKMEAWAQAATSEIEKVEQDRDSDRDKMEDYEKELSKARDDAEAYEHLVEQIMDVERGLMSFEELHADLARSAV